MPSGGDEYEGLFVEFDSYAIALLSFRWEGNSMGLILDARGSANLLQDLQDASGKYADAWSNKPDSLTQTFM